MKIKTIIALLLLQGISVASAQENLSLLECINLAVKNNINVVTARIEEQKSVHKVAETRSSLFPQLNGSAAFTDNLMLPTTILPGDFIGEPGTVVPVKMGVQYSTSLGVSVNQVLFDQTRFTGMRIAKQAQEISQLGVEKARESIAKEVGKLYFLIQTTEEQANLIEGNIERTKRMADVVKKLLDNGMGKLVDYDRINVTLQNLYTQLDNTRAMSEQQVNMMKYMLKIPNEQTIVLTESVSIPLFVDDLNAGGSLSSHIDIKMLESQKELSRLTLKNIENGYLPTLSFVGQYAASGMRRDFKNYFNNVPENRWYGSSYIGVSISIPIFDGFNERSKSRQAKLDYSKSQIIIEDTKEKLDIDFKNAINSYNNSKNNVDRQQQNIDLAEKVYRQTELKYKEGQSAITDLLQDEMGLSNAQSSYLNALYTFKEAELQIMSLNGEITKLINK